MNSSLPELTASSYGRALDIHKDQLNQSAGDRYDAVELPPLVGGTYDRPGSQQSHFNVMCDLDKEIQSEYVSFRQQIKPRSNAGSFAAASAPPKAQPQRHAGFRTAASHQKALQPIESKSAVEVPEAFASKAPLPEVRKSSILPPPMYDRIPYKVNNYSSNKLQSPSHKHKKALTQVWICQHVVSGGYVTFPVISTKKQKANVPKTSIREKVTITEHVLGGGYVSLVPKVSSTSQSSSDVTCLKLLKTAQQQMSSPSEALNQLYEACGMPKSSSTGRKEKDLKQLNNLKLLLKSQQQVGGELGALEHLFKVCGVMTSSSAAPVSEDPLSLLMQAQKRVKAPTPDLDRLFETAGLLEAPTPRAAKRPLKSLNSCLMAGRNAGFELQGLLTLNESYAPQPLSCHSILSKAMGDAPLGAGMDVLLKATANQAHLANLPQRRQKEKKKQKQVYHGPLKCVEMLFQSREASQMEGLKGLAKATSEVQSMKPERLTTLNGMLDSSSNMSGLTMLQDASSPKSKSKAGKFSQLCKIFDLCEKTEKNGSAVWGGVARVLSSIEKEIPQVIAYTRLEASYHGCPALGKVFAAVPELGPMVSSHKRSPDTIGLSLLYRSAIKKGLVEVRKSNKRVPEGQGLAVLLNGSETLKSTGLEMLSLASPKSKAPALRSAPAAPQKSALETLFSAHNTVKESMQGQDKGLQLLNQTVSGPVKEGSPFRALNVVFQARGDAKGSLKSLQHLQNALDFTPRSMDKLYAAADKVPLESFTYLKFLKKSSCFPTPKSLDILALMTTKSEAKVPHLQRLFMSE